MLGGNGNSYSRHSVSCKMTTWHASSSLHLQKQLNLVGPVKVTSSFRNTSEEDDWNFKWLDASHVVYTENVIKDTFKIIEMHILEITLSVSGTDMLVMLLLLLYVVRQRPVDNRNLLLQLVLVCC